MSHKSDKIAYRVSVRRAKSVYKSEKAAAEYAYKLERTRLKTTLTQSETAEHPKPSAKLRQEVKGAIRLAKQTCKNRKAQEKNIYLTEKQQAKQLYKKKKKWATTDRPPASLSYSLAAAFVLVFLLLMVLQEIFVLWTVEYLTNQQSDRQLNTVYSTMAVASFSEEAARHAVTNDISLVALREEGKSVYQVGEEKLAALVLEKGEGIHEISVGVTNYRVLCRNTDQGILYVAKNLQAEDDIFALLLVVMAVATVIAAIASGVVGISVSQSCLRPIHSMSRLMKEMNVSDLSARLDTRKIHTELRDVATHYNQMMDRLEASYAAQARFVSDASHELRTPLSVISGYADILERWGKEEPAVLEEAITSISDQCRQMNELLDRLLSLSHMDNALPELKAEEQEVYPLIQELTKDFVLLSDNRELNMEVPKSLRLY
ncbi:MAG: HAMP domain-containing protein, partial [Clostridia bacterium]|nr:HAMP domain-containing protein [Clostridia bacterium]